MVETVQQTRPAPKKSVALSGVVAGNTALCTVGRTGNDLHYRGYDILDVAERQRRGECHEPTSRRAAATTRRTTRSVRSSSRASTYDTPSSRQSRATCARHAANRSE